MNKCIQNAYVCRALMQHVEKEKVPPDEEVQNLIEETFLSLEAARENNGEFFFLSPVQFFFLQSRDWRKKKNEETFLSLEGARENNGEYICVCICILVCVCVCVLERTRVNTYVYVYVYTQERTQVNTYVYIYVY